MQLLIWLKERKKISNLFQEAHKSRMRWKVSKERPIILYNYKCWVKKRKNKEEKEKKGTTTFCTGEITFDYVAMQRKTSHLCVWQNGGLGQVIIYLRIVLVTLQVLPIDKALNPFLQIGRLYRKFQLSNETITTLYLLFVSWSNMTVTGYERSYYA